ncbi:uncharacterized protein LOC110628961 [Manihot esculenta]|uniref:Uncharacterized protein n=1 Tax=Manihot esculenta TaxID=3983 RepID=A0A2C9UPD0_MANES|nr:uncharacterized protein LOC110628961 [Manihot esculenta]OAY33002.1 hypothetical protein MANES_13G061900v8 [Manihot esculenta]
MPSLFCFFKNPLSWISVLVLVLAAFLGFGFSSSVLLTSVLTLSPLFFKFFKQKPKLVGKSVTPDQETTPESPRIEEKEEEEEEDIVCKERMPEDESIKEEKEDQEDADIGQIDEHIARSESDCCLYRSSTSDQDSEADWPFQDKTFQIPDVLSDGSISDEESLIEIALPGGHYICNKEEPKFNLQKKLPDFTTAGSFFKQHTLMELLAELNEMNEEENLIEIDISMGSIKCPRFEIEA